MIHRPIAAPSLLAVLLGLAGCGLNPAGSELDMTTTGSIARTEPPAAAPPLGYADAPARAKSVIDGVAPSDWERIRLFVSTNLTQAKIGEVLDWTNPETGSNGTVSPRGATRAASNERKCRAIQLTISDMRGIRGYQGDACATPDGMWQLFDITPEDGALL